MVEQRQITGQDIYEAIEKNGLQAIREEWFNFDGDTGIPIAACILGQAAINLHIAINNNFATNFDASLISQLNRYSVPEGNKWYLNPALHGISNLLIGNTIIYWYDLVDENKSVYNDNNWDYFPAIPEKIVYVLNGAEIMGMVKDVLTSVWDTAFTVDIYEFEVSNDGNSAN